MEGGRRCDELISLTDIFATVAAITGAPLAVGSGEDSMNVLPAWRDGTGVRTEMVYHAVDGALGLRQGDWVYLRAGNRPEPDWYVEELAIRSTDAPTMLFNLASDPGERNNLHDELAERVAAMERRLREIEGPSDPNA